MTARHMDRWTDRQTDRPADHNITSTCIIQAYATVLVKRRETRKLCYRKDDRAMRPIHGCPDNFRDSMTTSTATIPNIFSRAFVRIDPLNVPTKLEVRSFIRSSDNWRTAKIWTVPGYAFAPFSRKFLIGFYSD